LPQQRRVAFHRLVVASWRTARRCHSRDGADQRGATHLHRSNRVRNLCEIGQPQDIDRPGQLRLVEDVHRPLIRGINPDAAIPDPFNPHSSWSPQELQARVCSTQTSVNSRRAVGRSMSILRRAARTAAPRLVMQPAAAHVDRLDTRLTPSSTALIWLHQKLVVLISLRNGPRREA